MAAIEELIRKEDNGTISFGNYLLDKKSKADNFEHNGDIYKVKTYNVITKLECNGMFVYESVPGTAVKELRVTENGMDFLVEGKEDAQITVGLEDETEYKIIVDDEEAGAIKTNLGGKLTVGVEFTGKDNVKVSIVKL